MSWNIYQALLLTIHPQKLKSITSLLTSVKLTGLIPNEIRHLLKLDFFLFHQQFSPW